MDGFFIFFMILFFVTFLYVIIVNVKRVSMSMAENKRNRSLPRLTVPAKVITKRINVESHTHNHFNGQGNISSVHDVTHYFITFEFESGDRTEFKISGSDYGMLKEGDEGMLTVQGSKYIAFELNR